MKITYLFMHASILLITRDLKPNKYTKYIYKLESFHKLYKCDRELVNWEHSTLITNDNIMFDSILEKSKNPILGFAYF